jgi:hypothetical protein
MATQKDLRERPIKDLLNPQPQMTEDEENEFIADIANWISGEMQRSQSPFAVYRNTLDFIATVTLIAFDRHYFEDNAASRKWLEGGYGAGMISN